MVVEEVRIRFSCDASLIAGCGRLVTPRSSEMGCIYDRSGRNHPAARETPVAVGKPRAHASVSDWIITSKTQHHILWQRSGCQVAWGPRLLQPMRICGLSASQNGMNDSCQCDYLLVAARKGRKCANPVMRRVARPKSCAPANGWTNPLAHVLQSFFNIAALSRGSVYLAGYQQHRSAIVGSSLQ